MIPLRSTLRTASTATATIGLIAINLLIFLYQATLPELAGGGGESSAFVEHWGIVPANINGHLYTLFTSMFLHGGWLHLGGNMLFLWVFGRVVEDLIGSGRFLLFYLGCGLLAGVIQVISSPSSTLPTIGASGAIAGVMGAYLLKFPRSRIKTLIFVIVFLTTAEIPAWVMLLYWFVIQLVSGFGSLAANYTGGGVAWFAHIGGFLAGMLLIMLFPAKPRWRAWYED